MKFKANSDIDAPIDQVFQVVSDFDLVERTAMNRGIDVTRVEDKSPAAPGMAWDAGFKFRGKGRTARVALTEMNGPEELQFHTVSGGLEADVALELVALSPTQTRLAMKADLSPQTLPARLLVQSLKLARGTIDKRLQKRMNQMSKVIADRANSGS